MADGRRRGPYRRGGEKGPNIKQARPFDEAAQTKYLEEIVLHGGHVTASRAAGVTAQTVQNRIDSDDDFAARAAEAQAIHTEAVERELHRRAVEGYDEPVYNRGELVNTIRKYSDTLLLAKVRSRNSSYRQGDKLQIDQNTRHSGAIAHADLSKLTAEGRALLRQLIKTEAGDEEA